MDILEWKTLNGAKLNEIPTASFPFRASAFLLAHRKQYRQPHGQQHPFPYDKNIENLSHEES